jgi:hypothetical protein
MAGVHGEDLQQLRRPHIERLGLVEVTQHFGHRSFSSLIDKTLSIDEYTLTGRE